MPIFMTLGGEKIVSYSKPISYMVENALKLAGIEKLVTQQRNEFQACMCTQIWEHHNRKIN